MLGQKQPKMGDWRRDCQEPWQECLHSQGFKLGDRRPGVAGLGIPGYSHISHDTLVVVDGAVLLEGFHLLGADPVLSAGLLGVGACRQGVRRERVIFCTNQVLASCS